LTARGGAEIVKYANDVPAAAMLVIAEHSLPRSSRGSEYLCAKAR
jgi:hypothetical protein